MTEELNESTKRELQSTKRELQSTKRELQSTKRELQSTKREFQSTKRITDIATEYGDLGAAGNYTVNTSIAGEEKVPIIASSIRVLGGGELNFLTDTGQWFLFAQGTWKSVRPTQPDPKTLEDKG